MSKRIEIGRTKQSKTVELDLGIFLKTRLLVTANSGGGKSWLLRRLAELINPVMPVMIFDLEGEFSTLRESFDFVLVGKGGETPADCRSAKLLMHKLLELRASAVFDCSELAIPDKHRFIRLLCEAAIESPKPLWRPTTFMFDESHVVCPENGKGESEAKNAVLAFPSRGRKRQFGSIFATQRLAKLSKDARAEMQNRMIGQMIEPDDIEAAAKIMGTPRNEMEVFAKSLRTMDEGNFFAFGRAVSNESVLVKVGSVQTSHETDKQKLRHGNATPPAPDKIKALLPKLADLPQLAEEQAQTLAEVKAALRSAKAEIVTLKRAQPVPAKTETKIQKERILTPGDSKRLTKLVAVMQTLKADCQEFSKKAEVMLDESRHFMRLLAPAIAPQFAPSIPHARDIKSGAVVVVNNLVPHLPPKPKLKLDPEYGENTRGNVPNISQILRGGVLDTLKVCAQYPQGATDSQIAVLTSYKATSRVTFRSTLMSAGLIQKKGDGWVATEAGIEALGSDFEPLPHGVELQEYWRRRLRGGELVCFETFVKAYPGPATKEMLFEATGLKATSIVTFKSSLRARCLIEGDTASANLFD